MITPTDFRKPTDLAKPTQSVELVQKAKAEVDRLTKQLEQSGVDPQKAGMLAEQVNAKAEGPIAHNDWMSMDAERFKPSTQSALDKQGLTPEAVLDDPAKTEAYTGQVLKMEGMPSGNGDTEPLQGVTPGHYDQAGHGIDLVGANKDGTPIPIEVKDRNQPSGAKLSEHATVKLEPEVETWRSQREAQAGAQQAGKLADVRPDAQEAWKPEVRDWQKQVSTDAGRMTDNKGSLPVQQMDSLWTQDRWLKLIKTPEGQQRLADAKVAPKYLDYQKLKSSPDLPEWRSILDQRTVVVVSGRQGDAGRGLFNQAVVEGRAKRVAMIKVG